ncbi:3-deoxy-7-phosphoheptulonate synthase [Lipingzhangella sp. LS1_29]|uniref:Phospho-2-dehydro-3-deoxyheptonate aldolase n=1 Tax=Lipingzhangella rawalii TaxID=2055835 RepID=A0ABU2H877_9ACTN|nr:3-deoxy-7-phosphoheptulonate synthase [Lipingzhangella rawalii]MDS1271516.1 3-deoxy-7-phosphoheptulonate synthase [Lipingzhangella rawalii]
MSDLSTAPTLLNARHQPDWACPEDLADSLEQLRSRAPLVTFPARYSLQRELSDIASGHGLFLQSGDCAERFADATPERMGAKIELLGRMADLVESATATPVVRIGRFAGQHAKPRSQRTETTADGRVLPVYLGDAVNAAEEDAQARTCDARRLLSSYDHSARALDSLFPAGLLPPYGGVDAPFSVTYASHEALLIDYENALVREEEHGRGHYASSAHYLWIGERTRDVDGAHVAFAERVNNPIGVKVGPHACAAELTTLVRRLAEGHAPGRLSLIIRMGDSIEERLPLLLQEMGTAAHRVLWVCDPMHGNTRNNRHGQKTRVMTDILAEVRRCLTVLRKHGLRLSGLHLETTPEPVLECVDSAADLEHHLDRYTSACDPRLNGEQALAVVSAAVGWGWSGFDPPPSGFGLPREAKEDIR